MSEPVIKPVLWRCACDRRPCLGLQVCRETPPTPLYTRDDLVRVARECNRLWDESTAFDDETAEATRVVDRLTKGET